MKDPFFSDVDRTICTIRLKLEIAANQLGVHTLKAKFECPKNSGKGLKCRHVQARTGTSAYVPAL